jgi:hypothetical protein
MSDKVQTVEVDKQIEGKTVVSLSLPSPKWATWVFRIVFNLTLVAVIWIAGTGKISDETKVELMLILKVADNFIWGVARGLGVEKKTFENEAQ